MNFDYGWLFSQFVQTVLPSFAPIAVASVVALWPGDRPAKKLLFVFVSAALVWGVPTVISVLFAPFEFHAIYVEPTLQANGYRTIPDIVVSTRKYSTHIFIGVLAVLSIVVPVYLRVRIWPSVFSRKKHEQNVQS